MSHLFHSVKVGPVHWLGRRNMSWIMAVGLCVDYGVEPMQPINNHPVPTSIQAIFYS